MQPQQPRPLNRGSPCATTTTPTSPVLPAETRAAGSPAARSQTGSTPADASIASTTRIKPGSAIAAETGSPTPIQTCTSAAGQTRAIADRLRTTVTIPTSGCGIDASFGKEKDPPRAGLFLAFSPPLRPSKKHSPQATYGRSHRSATDSPGRPTPAASPPRRTPGSAAERNSSGVSSGSAFNASVEGC